jgi:hypothetical protein
LVRDDSKCAAGALRRWIGRTRRIGHTDRAGSQVLSEAQLLQLLRDVAPAGYGLRPTKEWVGKHSVRLYHVNVQPLRRGGDEEEWLRIGQGLLNSYRTGAVPWFDLAPVLRGLVPPGDLASGRRRGLAVSGWTQLRQPLRLECLPGVTLVLHPFAHESTGDLVSWVRSTASSVLRIGVTQTTGEAVDSGRGAGAEGGPGWMTILARLKAYLQCARPLAEGTLELHVHCQKVPNGQVSRTPFFWRHLHI